jgi:hypothetical protein
MEIALIIVGGLVLMTIFASGFDFLTKRRNKLDNDTKLKVIELEEKVSTLERMSNDKDDKINQLDSDLSFLNKLIEKK